MTQTVLGPTGGRKRRLLIFGVVIAAVLILPTFVFANALPPTGAGNDAVNAPRYEFDGNLESGNDGAGGGTVDWFNGSGQELITDAARASDGSCTGDSTDPANFVLGGTGSAGEGVLVCDGTASKDTPADANGFTQGQHEDEGDNPINWVVDAVSSPKKTDLSEIYIAGKVFDSPFDGNSLADNLLFFFDTSRLDTNGDFHIDFELNQKEQTDCGDSDPKTVCQPRTVNDVIVSYDSAGGNAPPTATVYKWQETLLSGQTCASSQADLAGAPGCYVLLTNPPAQGGLAAAAGVFNTAEIPAGPWEAVVCDPTSNDNSHQCTLRDQIPAGGNMEGYIDITGFIPGFSLCPGFGQVSAKSRSSSGINASLQDTSGPLGIDAAVCGSLLIKKTGNAGELLGGATFTISPDPRLGQTGGSLAIADDNGSTPSGLTDQSAAAGIVCIAPVQLTSYSITETGVPTGYFGDSDTVTKTVSSSSTCADRLNADGTIKSGQTPDAEFQNLLGSILIKKIDGSGNLLAGATFTVTPDPSVSSPGASKDFTDGGTGDQSAAGGVVCIDGVRNLGTGNDYTVTEKTPPSGWFGDSSSITVGVHSPSKCADRLNADGTIKNGQTPNATFTNKKASLVIRKLAKNKSCTAAGEPIAACTGPGTALFAGATFTITPSPSTGSSLDVTDGSGTDQYAAGGVICIDNVNSLGAGNSYSIVEKNANNANYQKDPDTETVANGSLSLLTCAARSTAAGGNTLVTPDVTFTNTPLSSVQVIFSSSAGAGVTAASIDCGTDPSKTDLSPTPNDATDGALDDSSETYPGLAPGTYNCVVVIDP